MLSHEEILDLILNKAKKRISGETQIRLDIGIINDELWKSYVRQLQDDGMITMGTGLNDISMIHPTIKGDMHIGYCKTRRRNNFKSYANIANVTVICVATVVSIIYYLVEIQKSNLPTNTNEERCSKSIVPAKCTSQQSSPDTYNSDSTRETH